MGSVADTRTKASTQAVLEIITRGGVLKDVTSHPLARQEAEWIADSGFSNGAQEIAAADILAIRIGGLQ